MTLLFGYMHVGPEVPRCPCGDPGNYMMMEQSDSDPLDCRMVCWCGAALRVRFDSAGERDEFVAAQTKGER